MTRVRPLAAVPEAFHRWVATHMTERSYTEAPFFIPFLASRAGEPFLPTPGSDRWLDTCDESEWPGFDTARYYCVATNTQGNYWLFDLATDAAVVYFDHERGFGASNFRPVAASWEELAQKIRPMRDVT